MSLIGINCVGQFNFSLSFTIMTALPVTIVVIAVLEYCFVSKTLSAKLKNMSEPKKIEKEKEALDLLFKMADEDHSGVIDPSEISHILHNLGWKVDLTAAMYLNEKIGGSLNRKGKVLDFFFLAANTPLTYSLNKVCMK